MKTAGKLVRWHIRLVYASSRKFREPLDIDTYISGLAPIVMTTWHGQFLLISCFKPKSIPVSVMVARHTDGEALARAVNGLGMDLIRGAGSGESGKDRGGMVALRAAVEALRSGVTVAMTADIPPGPARVAGLGVVMIARISGRPIVPVATATRRFITFPTWSRFTFNLPFSTVAGVAGEPIYVPRNISNEELEAYRQKVEDALNDVTARAYRLAGSDAARVLPASLSPPKKTGLLLSAYRGVTSAARPLAPLLLSRRASHGKEIPERLCERLGVATKARPTGPLFWFHAASVGETNAILPVISELKQRHPRLNILLTTVTVTSFKIAETRLPPGSVHQFLPLDNLSFVRRFLNHWTPDAGVFIESEIWPNLIVEAADRGTPLFLVNARMSPKSAKRWGRFSSIGKPVFSRFTSVLAQNARIAKRLRSVGVRNTIVTGNLKYDAPPPPVEEAGLDALRRATAGRFVFLAASTHPGEDEIILDAHAKMQASIPTLLTVIVPRHPQRGDAIAGLLSARGVTFARRSQGQLVGNKDAIYLADTLGELGLFYSLAPISFVGGSLVPRGGQNPIEAIKLGSAVISGWQYHNFAETYEALRAEEGCRIVGNGDELAAAVLDLSRDEALTGDMRKKAGVAIAKLSGAIDRTLKVLEPFVREAFEKVESEPEHLSQLRLEAPEHAA